MQHKINKKICLIGNNNFCGPISDGQRIKVRTYLDILDDEGFDIFLVELEGWKKRLFKTVSLIKKGIKTCDIILIMAGPAGCRKIIPLVLFLNRKYKKRIVYSAIGTGTISNQLEALDAESSKKFFEGNFSILSDQKMGNDLKKLDAILLETDTLLQTYQRFYSLDNCYLITNFRKDAPSFNNFKSEKIKIVFISRVESIKGILVLLEAIKLIPDFSQKASLDIFGPCNFSKIDQEKFNSYLNLDSVYYKGIMPLSKVVNELQNYSLFCFPTIYTQEGTPGVLIESLLAGTPILSSDFFQAKNILTFGYDSISCKMGDVNDLKEKIEMIINNPDVLKELKQNIIESRKKFLYKNIRKDFLKYLTGEDVE